MEGMNRGVVYIVYQTLYTILYPVGFRCPDSATILEWRKPLIMAM